MHHNCLVIHCEWKASDLRLQSDEILQLLCAHTFLAKSLWFVEEHE